MKNTISQRNTFLYYLTQFFDSLNFNIPIIIVFLQGRVTVPEVTFLFAYRYFVQLVVELPTGAFADLFGKKVSVAIGFFINYVYFIGVFFSPSFLWFIVFYTIGGIGDSFMSGSIDALVYDSLKQDGKTDQYSKILANQNMIYQFGLIIGTIAGGFLYTINHAYTFFLNGTMQLSAFVVCLFLIEPHVDTVRFTLRNYLLQIRQGTKELFKTSHSTKVSLFYMVVGGITWSCIMLFNSYMLVDLKFNNDMRGILEGGLRLINVFILNYLFTNKKIFTKTVTFLYFPIAMALAFLPGPWLGGYMALPFIGLAMLSGSARWIILAKYTNEEYESKYRATALSALSMFVGLIYVVLVWASGPIIANFGGVRTVYFILGIITLILVTPLSYTLLTHPSENKRGLV